MTISSSINKSGPYNGNGSTTVFARTFRVLDADHLKVYQTKDGVTTEVTTGITKDGIGSDSGNVTFDTAPASGVQITLLREIPLVQETDYSSQGKVAPVQIEDDLDGLQMQVQDMFEQVTRSIRLPVNARSGLLSSVRPGEYLRLNDDLTGLTSTPLSAIFSEIAIWYNDRDATSAAAAVSQGNGSIVSLGGFFYKVDTSATGTASATHDLGVDGLVVFFDAYGAVPAGAFGIVDNAGLDQWQKMQVAVNACSPVRRKIDIGGLTIAIGKQNTGDDVYSDVRANPETGLGRTYAILIPPGGYMALCGKGTVKNLNANDKQYIFHSVDSTYVEIGDHVTLDGNHTAHGWGGCLHLMGLEHLHLGLCTFTQDGICRVGASETRRSGLITFTHPRWIDCWGTHCIGGKPGGFTAIFGNSLTFIDCRGGLNIETEDVNGLNDDGAGGKRWDTKIIGQIGAVRARDLDGDKDPSFLCPAAVVVCTDAEGSHVSIGLIDAKDVSASQNAECLLFGGGQDDLPYASINVGTIRGDNITAAVRYDATNTGGEVVNIGQITGDFTKIVKANISATTTTAPGKARLLNIENIDVDSVTEGFAIFNGREKYISNATQTNPCVITTTRPHGFLDGHTVDIYSAGTMTELNERRFTITVEDERTFSLNGEDATGHTAYESRSGSVGSGALIGTAHPGSLIEELRIGRGRIETATNVAAYIRDVDTLTIGDLTWGDVTTFLSAQGYENFALSVKVERMKVKDRLRSENSHSHAMRIEIKETADLAGIDVVTTEKGGGVALAGAGDVVLRDGQIRATGRDSAGNPILDSNGRPVGGFGLRSPSFLDSDGDRKPRFTGNVDLINFDLNGTGIDEFIVPRRIRNSDVLKADLSDWDPGAVEAGTPVTTTVTVKSVKPNDFFTIRPTSWIDNTQNLDFVAYSSAENTVTVAVRNLDSENTRNPGSATYEIIGERG